MLICFAYGARQLSDSSKRLSHGRGGDCLSTGHHYGLNWCLSGGWPVGQRDQRSWPLAALLQVAREPWRARPDRRSAWPETGRNPAERCAAALLSQQVATSF